MAILPLPPVSMLIVKQSAGTLNFFYQLHS
jgi:hypothetical protein